MPDVGGFLLNQHGGSMRLFLTFVVFAMAIGAGCSKNRTPSPSDALPGRQVYEVKNCTRCHGADAEGGTSAPSLRNIGSHLTKAQIVEFLKDPARYMKTDARLAEQASRFPTKMPAYPYMEQTDLELLADYLLALK
jgi:mono/diheme cytochrome c family protein